MVEDVQKQQDTIIELLLATKREGMDKLVLELLTPDFFIAPASIRFHGSYVGGLAKHSFDVCQMVLRYNGELKLGIAEETITVSTLLHDVCKIGAYVKRDVPIGDAKPSWYWNRAQPKGHALLSLVRVAEHIALTELEVLMIRYHMGVYGLNELDHKGEYPLRGGGLAYAWHHHPIVKVMYFCDELITLGEKP